MPRFPARPFLRGAGNPILWCSFRSVIPVSSAHRESDRPVRFRTSRNDLSLVVVVSGVLTGHSRSRQARGPDGTNHRLKARSSPPFGGFQPIGFVIVPSSIAPKFASAFFCASLAGASPRTTLPVVLLTSVLCFLSSVPHFNSISFCVGTVKGGLVRPGTYPSFHRRCHQAA